ncbi:MAG: transcription elongation factor GreA [Actinomycetaceae bacterium]|nr:transcription elongation factor GreA [Actinomycetaceae bacterium]
MAEKKWLTQEAYDHLLAELDNLKNVERPAIAKRIDEARQEGDLKENGGYHAAREQQSWNETRIAQLEELLEAAEVGETPPDDGIVEPGMIVEAQFAGSTHRFLLGSRQAAVGLDIEVFSPNAPLGKAIMGHKAGDKVSYLAPNGKTINVDIISATPYKG